MDKGPWMRLYNSADECVGIVSDDFTHDVALRVSGDFENRAQFKAYCDWLAARLSITPQAPIARLQILEDGRIAVEVLTPGLPPGKHLLYCEPEATAPYLRDSHD